MSEKQLPFNLDRDGVRRVILERVRLSVRAVLPRGLHEAELQFYRDLEQNLIVELSGFLAGKKLHEFRYDVEVPETWWQHFKQTHFPLWLSRKFPVRMRHIRVLDQKTYLVLPSIEVHDDKYWPVYLAEFWGSK